MCVAYLIAGFTPNITTPEYIYQIPGDVPTVNEPGNCTVPPYKNASDLNSAIVDALKAELNTWDLLSTSTVN